MLHRYLHELLTIGIQKMKDDSRLLDDLFERWYALDDSEVDAIKQYFAAKGLNVANGYARRDAKFPLVTITLGAEGETDSFLGDSAGQITTMGDDYGADLLASLWQHTYNLTVFTEHPDVTAYYYEIVKSILIAGLQFLVTELNLFQFKISGMDLAPDPQYVPEHLFVRQLTLTCQREFQRIDRESLLAKAFGISGIHIDKSGSPSDVGGVKTLVTFFTEGQNGEE